MSRFESMDFIHIEPGIFHGNLVFGSQNVGESVMSECSLLKYPNMDQPGFQLPLSLVLTEFHFLLLYPRKIQAISTLTSDVVWEQSMDYSLGGDLRGLAQDVVTRIIWMYSDKAIFEVVVRDEDRNVWELYMRQEDYESALKYCKV